MDGHDLPGPIPAASDAAFWLACRQGELAFRRCVPCGAWHHPPLPLCPTCQSTKLEWRRAEGPILLYSWTRAHVAMHASVAGETPYYIGLVEFPECGGVRLLARLEHAGADSPVIGAGCELFWLGAADGQSVPALRTLP